MAKKKIYRKRRAKKNDRKKLMIYVGVGIAIIVAIMALWRMTA